MKPTTYHGKVLVLGDEVRSLLSVIRSLGRGGIEVHMAWHPPDSEALHSRYLRTAHNLPAFDPASAAWKEALIALMKRERFDLVIPCSDPTLIPLQTHREDLEPFGKIYLLDDEVFQIVFDKLRTNHLARSAGVRVPREWVVSRPEEAEALLAELELPVVLKPEFSFDPATVGRRRKVRKAYSWGDYLRLVRIMLGAGPVAVQENFIGEGVGVELLLNAGEPLMRFQHRRLHEPLHGGGSSYRQSVPVDPSLLEASLAILRPIRYTGVAMVEFKVNRATRDWRFIEVNARFWGSLPLAIASGADFPLALFQFLIAGRTDFPSRYRLGLCCRNWRLDRTWLSANFRADHCDPTLATRSIGRVLSEPLINAVTLREHSDCFTWDDPGPGLAELRLIAKDGVAGIQRKVLRRYLQHRRARPRLRRRAAAAWARARTVLFVCLGNICRSPFAEHLARKHSGSGRTFVSAGYYPRQGRVCPDLAVATAKKWDVDLSPHRSRPLTADLVRAVDAVFVFDMANYERIWANFPAARTRLHFLRALGPDDSLIIDDPYGAEAEAFEETYDLIARALGVVRKAESKEHGLSTCKTRE